MSDNDFLSWYRELRLAFEENHPDTVPTEFHITNADSLRLISLAKLLTPDLRQKFILEGARKPFPTLFNMTVVYGAKESRIV